MKNFASRATWKFFAVFFVGVALVGGLYLHGMEDAEKQIDENTEIYLTFKRKKDPKILMEQVSQEALGLSGQFKDIAKGTEQVRSDGVIGKNTFYDQAENMMFVSLNSYLDQVKRFEVLALKDVKGFITVWDEFAQSGASLPNLTRLSKEQLRVYVALADFFNVTELDEDRGTSLLDFLAEGYAEKMKEQVEGLTEEDYIRFLTVSGQDKGKERLLDDIEGFGSGLAMLLGQKLFKQKKDIEGEVVSTEEDAVSKLFALKSGDFKGGDFVAFGKELGVVERYINGDKFFEKKDFADHNIIGAVVSPNNNSLYLLKIPKEKREGSKNKLFFLTNIEKDYEGPCGGAISWKNAFYTVLPNGEVVIGNWLKDKKTFIDRFNYKGELQSKRSLLLEQARNVWTVIPREKRVALVSFQSEKTEIITFDFNLEEIDRVKFDAGFQRSSLAVAFSSKKFALHSVKEKKIFVVDLPSKEMVSIWKGSSIVNSLAVLPNENYLAFVSGDKKIRILDVVKKKEVFEKDLLCEPSISRVMNSLGNFRYSSEGASYPRLVLVPGGWLVSSCDEKIQKWDIYPFLDLYKGLTFKQAVLVKYLQLKRLWKKIPKEVKNNQRFLQIYGSLPEKVRQIYINLHQVLSY